MTLILLVLLLLLTASKIPYWMREYRLKHWRRSLNLNQHRAHFQSVFEDVDGFKISRLARASHDAMEYTYGEIEFEPFIALISLTHPNSSTIFYDLGSGTGKAVFACAMVFNMQHYCGVELFTPLHQSALTQKKRLQQVLADKTVTNKIHFINDNFLNVDLSRATLIFINATAYFGPTWEQLNQRLSQVAPGTVVITTSKKLTSKAFIITQTTQVNMSWDVVTAYIHRSIE